MKRLETCCFCYNLHRGSVIIAVIYIVAAVVGLVIGALDLLATHVPAPPPDQANATSGNGDAQGGGLLSTTITHFDDDSETEKELEINYGVTDWLDIALSALEILMASLLLFGLLSRRHWFVLPWLILEVVSLMLGYVTVPAGAIFLFLNNDVVNGVVTLLLGLPFLLVATYFFVVVYSRYKELREEAGAGDVTYNRFTNAVNVETPPPPPTSANGNGRLA